MNAPVSNSYQLLPPLERAQFFKRTIESGTSASNLARNLGKSLAYISNTLRLLKLPDVVKDALMSQVISEGHARALLGAKKEEVCIEVFKQVLTTNASVRQTEQLVRSHTASPVNNPVSPVSQSGQSASTETSRVPQ